ncbi:MAG: hypothetical protein ACOYB2_19740 [Limnohabitans sp.]
MAAVVVKAQINERKWDGGQSRWDVSFAEGTDGYQPTIHCQPDRKAVFAWAHKQAARLGRTIRIDWLNEAGEPIRTVAEAGK